MGLGLRGGIKLHGVWGLLTGYGDKKLKEIARLAQAYAIHHDIEAAFRSQETATGYRLSFHPAEQDILLSLAGGYAVMDARTSSAGPGYHAFVVGFIDYLGQHQDWKWDFNNPSQGFSDETGYYNDRDFTALRHAMADAFTAICRVLLDPEADDEGPYYLSLPLEVSIDVVCFAATTLGFRHRSFFESPAPEQFFPWWEEGVTAQTLRHMALCKMWLDISWRPPAGDTDWRDLEICQRLIDRARTQGAAFADNEGAEDIDVLLRGEPLDTVDEDTRIGYWRQPIRYLGTDGWSVSLPAYYQEDISEEGELCSLAHGDRAVHMRSNLFETVLEELEWPVTVVDGGDEYLRFKTDHYWAIFSSYETQENETGLWVWQGMYLALDGFATITAVSLHEADAAWAEKVLRSARSASDRTGIVKSIAL